MQGQELEHMQEQGLENMQGQEQGLENMQGQEQGLENMQGLVQEQWILQNSKGKYIQIRHLYLPSYQQ
jgi:hypothetical protein